MKRWRWDWWIAHAAYMVTFGSTVFGLMYLFNHWSECVTIGRAALYLMIGVVAIVICAITMSWMEETSRRYKRAAPKPTR